MQTPADAMARAAVNVMQHPQPLRLDRGHLRRRRLHLATQWLPGSVKTWLLTFFDNADMMWNIKTRAVTIDTLVGAAVRKLTNAERNEQNERLPADLIAEATRSFATPARGRGRRY